jgi:ubiquinone/menaquinone biosynthesis C-methylase UbiE
MTNLKKHHVKNHHPHGTGRGPSSFWMHDSKAVFDALALKPGDAFLDLGCGPGDYAVAAAHAVAASGAVTALDKWQYLIDGLRDTASSQGLDNLTAMVADITGSLPIEDHSIDLCLLATVLHIFRLPLVEKTLFKEIHRILKPSGRLAIIECKKEEQPFGPPLHLRISPQELERSLRPFGFVKIDYRDLGHTYLICFGGVCRRP